SQTVLKKERVSRLSASHSLKRSRDGSDRTYVNRRLGSGVRANFRIARFRLLRSKHPPIGVGVYPKILVS
ncbi:MAG TPA: hypothetical protein VF019_08575, partial [Nitrospira sp.]